MNEVLVLCYHAVSPTWAAPLSVTPEAFERQISMLARRGWQGVTFRDAVLNPPFRRTVAVTFDDAFASVQEFAVPVLSRLGFPATVFAPTAFLSSGTRLDYDGIKHWHGSADANELTPLSWDDLRSLAQRGWEIGSHTRTHPHLTRVDDDQLRIELEESRDELREAIGASCDTIAYPYGDVDQRVARCAQRAGYVVGAGLASRLEPLGVLRWPRVGIYHLDEVRWRFQLKIMRPVRDLRASRLWWRTT